MAGTPHHGRNAIPISFPHARGILPLKWVGYPRASLRDCVALSLGPLLVTDASNTPRSADLGVVGATLCISPGCVVNVNLPNCERQFRCTNRGFQRPPANWCQLS